MDPSVQNLKIDRIRGSQKIIPTGIKMPARLAGGSQKQLQLQKYAKSVVNS